jgi:hypothetical protein
MKGDLYVCEGDGRVSERLGENTGRCADVYSTDSVN